MEKQIAMEKRIALIGIIVEDTSSTAVLNDILHEYGGDIVAVWVCLYRGARRMYHQRCGGCAGRPDQLACGQVMDG